jgi:hypothetical protein
MIIGERMNKVKVSLCILALALWFAWITIEGLKRWVIVW